MIKLQMTMHSLVFYKPVQVTIVLPYAPLSPSGPYKTLWLLHPAMGNGDFFFDNFALSALVDKQHIAIVAPSLGNGYFMNSSYEQQASFLEDELRPYLQSCFPLSDRKQDNHLLGISMGAFGAVRWALSVPHAFGAVAAISGVYDVRLPLDTRAKKSRLLRPLVMLFGEKLMPKLFNDEAGIVHPNADINMLIVRISSEECPRLALFCGEEDYISLNQTEALAEHCAVHGLDVEAFYSTGTHDLAYWSTSVVQAFHWLFKEV